MVTKRTFPRETTAPNQLDFTLSFNDMDVLEHMGGPGDGFGRRRSSGHARAAAETAGCRLGRRRSWRRGPELGVPASSSGPPAEAPIDEASSFLVGASVGRSGDRSGLVWVYI